MKKLSLILLFLASSLFAGGDRFYDYAKVKYSEPVYEYVYDREPQRECKEVKQRVRNYDDRYYSNNSYDNSLGLDTLVGVAAGVAIGNQVGGGSGRDVAKVLGGLIGGKVAHEIRNNYHPNGYNKHRYNNNYYNDDYEIVTKCYNTSKRVKRKMITGYKNYFVYKGVEHYKITSKPQRRIKITHTINF